MGKRAKNYGGCWTCRVRKKGNCEEPYPTGDCNACMDLNIKCWRGYGERVPPEYCTRELKEKLKEWNIHPANRGNKNQLHLAPTQSGSLTPNGGRSTDRIAQSTVVDELSESLTPTTANEGSYLGAPPQNPVQRCGSTSPSCSSPPTTTSSNSHLGDIFDFRAAQSCSSSRLTLNNTRCIAPHYPEELMVSSILPLPDLALSIPTLRDRRRHCQMANTDSFNFFNHPSRFPQAVCTIGTSVVQHAPVVAAAPSESGGHRGTPPGSGGEYGGSWTNSRDSGNASGNAVLSPGLGSGKLPVGHISFSLTADANALDTSPAQVTPRSSHGPRVQMGEIQEALQVQATDAWAPQSAITHRWGEPSLDLLSGARRTGFAGCPPGTPSHDPGTSCTLPEFAPECGAGSHMPPNTFPPDRYQSPYEQSPPESMEQCMNPGSASPFLGIAGSPVHSPSYNFPARPEKSWARLQTYAESVPAHHPDYLPTSSSAPRQPPVNVIDSAKEVRNYMLPIADDGHCDLPISTGNAAPVQPVESMYDQTVQTRPTHKGNSLESPLIAQRIPPPVLPFNMQTWTAENGGAQFVRRDTGAPNVRPRNAFTSSTDTPNRLENSLDGSRFASGPSL